MKTKISKLSILIAVFYLSSKCFIALENRYGFIIGAFAAMFATYKFWQVDKAKMLGFLESFIVLVYSYSFYRWSESGGLHITLTERYVSIISTIVVLIFCIFRFLYIKRKQGKVSIELTLEIISVAAFTLGGLLIIYKIAFGWILYGIAHASTAWLQKIKKDTIFMYFQVISAIVAIIGYIIYILSPF